MVSVERFMNDQGSKDLLFVISLGGLKKDFLFPFPVYTLTPCPKSFLAMSHPSLHVLAISALFDC